MIKPRLLAAWVLLLALACSAWSQEPSSLLASPEETTTSTRDILPAGDWDAIDKAVDRALEWIAGQQERDGRFRSIDQGQPGVTSLCILAFLSRGHVPGEGPYGRLIDDAVRFISSCQQSDGLLTYLQITPSMGMGAGNAVHAASYNHPICGLTLCEIYGMSRKEGASRIRGNIEQALNYSRRLQIRPKDSPADRGGWRYLRDWPGSDSDLSATSWHLLFYRSAKNAGFDVPSQFVDEAMEYVNRCYDEQQGTFRYGLVGGDRHTSTSMSAAGILSLSLGGYHDTDKARAAGDWILRNPFTPYLYARGDHEGMYFYAAFYCSQAMHQLGGRYWKEFYPHLVGALVPNQRRDGSWDPETDGSSMYGNVYTTALAVIALTTPYELLPIFQR